MYMHKLDVISQSENKLWSYCKIAWGGFAIPVPKPLTLPTRGNKTSSNAT
jgi:hypothetical protein